MTAQAIRKSASQSKGLPSDGIDPDIQLRKAMELLTEAFDRKGQLAQNEVAHWKQVASHQREQMAQMEDETQQLKRKVEDLEKIVGDLHKEKRVLVASKNSLVDKYNQLRKNAIQLDTFRKQIVNMVEYSPSVVQIPEADASLIAIADGNRATQNAKQAPLKQQLNLHSTENAEALFNAASAIQNLGELSMMDPASFNTDEFMRTTNIALGNSQNGAKQQRLQQAFPQDFDDKFMNTSRLTDALETLHLTPFRADNIENIDLTKSIDEHKTPSRKPQQHQTQGNHQKSFTSTKGNNFADTSIDAPTLYKQIRSILSPQDFDNFATQIAEFNAGNQTAGHTVMAISRLIKDQKLVQQMKTLIMKALAETSQASISSNQFGKSQTADTNKNIQKKQNIPAK